MKKILLFVLTSIVFTIICLSVQNTYSIFIKTVNSNITLTTTKLEATFLPGSDFNAKIKQLAGNDNANYGVEDTYITGIVRSNILNITPTTNNVVSTSDSPFPIYAWFSNGIIYYYTEVEYPKLNSNSSYMFYDLMGITNISGLSSMNASNVLNMSRMFTNSIVLSDISPIENWNVSNVTDMEAMFCLGQNAYNTYGLGSITDFSPIENWNVSSVQTMRQMFKFQSMTEIDLSKWNTSSVTSTEIMFYGCRNLETVDISSFNLSNVTNSNSIFYNAANLKELKTPRYYPNDTSVVMPIPKTLYDSNLVGYTTLGSSTTPVSPIQTWIKEGYIVTLDPNGGSVSPSTKIYRYGDKYENLPTPTRLGYQFLGWNGKNKFNKSKYLNKEDYTVTNSNNSAYIWAEIDLEENKTYKVSVVRYNNYDGKTNTMILSKTKSPGIDGGWSAIAHATAPNNSQTGYMYTINSGEKLYIGYYNTMTQAEMDTIWANTDVQIEEGTIATTYEPYYVTSNTDITVLENHTLTAKWIDNQAPSLSLKKWTYKSDDFSNWEVIKNAYIDSNGILVLGEDLTFANVFSPYYETNGGLWYPEYEALTSTALPNKSTGGVYNHMDYYDSNYTATPDIRGNTNNSIAFGASLNTWTTSLTDTRYLNPYLGQGNDIKYIKLSISTENNWSKSPVKIRNFKFWAEDMPNSFYYIYVTSSDNVGVVETKYAKGNQNKAYFENNGKIVVDNQISVNENGTYTVFVRDEVGNSTIQTIEINRIIDTPWNYTYNGTDGTDGRYQTFTAPASGTYKIELWGAQGGSTIETLGIITPGGLGGYTKGEIDLEKGETLYIYVGGEGKQYDGEDVPNQTMPGGYNGGGSARLEALTAGSRISTGGGATDVRLTSGTWNNFDSLKSRIMVAAGGAGSDNNANNGYLGVGGAAGGLTGYSGTTNQPSGVIGTGGTQTLGGTNTIGTEYGGFGFATGSEVKSNSGGGGGGYYGGSKGYSYRSGGGGGSSFISGYSGCNAISSNSTSDSITHLNSPNHSSGKKFNSGTMSMIDGEGCNWSSGSATLCGTNQPQPDGTTSIGHLGNGYARITLVNLE